MFAGMCWIFANRFVQIWLFAYELVRKIPGLGRALLLAWFWFFGTPAVFLRHGLQEASCRSAVRIQCRFFGLLCQGQEIFLVRTRHGIRRKMMRAWRLGCVRPSNNPHQSSELRGRERDRGSAKRALYRRGGCRRRGRRCRRRDSVTPSAGGGNGNARDNGRSQ